MRIFIILYVVAINLCGTSVVANDHFHCFPMEPVVDTEPLMCPRSPLSVGQWELEAVTNVTAFVIKDGQRAYQSQSMGGAKFNATLNPLSCDGQIEINLLQSGRSFILSEVAESRDEGETDHSRLVGTTVIQPALNLIGNVELRASGRNQGVLSLTVDGAAFADVAKGGVVMSMEFIDDREDIHPYCDCRTQLRTYLDSQIAYYEGIMASYENTDFWEKPEGWPATVHYNYTNYNQFHLMVREGRLSQEEIVQCFSDQYDYMEPWERAAYNVADAFKQRGRAGAYTDPTTCIQHNVGGATGTCYPDIVNQVEAEHEASHALECEVVRDGLAPALQDKEVFDYIEDTKIPVGDALYPINTEPQALAESEIRAYTTTLSLLRTWEADNCGG